jgi:2,3-dihydroxybenzoate decarboxylase
MKKIALEEHFMAPGFEEYWAPSVENMDRQVYSRILTRLTDFAELRLESMDRAGISRSVLGLAGPGVQVERDTAIACRKAREVNDWLAREIEKQPERYAGFAHLALQDPHAAADELEHCVRVLGFCGAMINGHTNGQYLDDVRFDPFWERAQDLAVPIYLHPADPVAAYPAMAGFNSLKRAMWEWGVETGTHALRLILGGVFDRFPRATLILGHMGETLPYLLWRFDSRAQLYGLKLKKRPSEYIREHIFVTTSGMFSLEPLQCAIGALGAERVMFSVDYPFESVDEAAQFIEGIPFDAATRQAICFDNAARVLGLNGNSKQR